jgi:hypothetical protein
VNPGRSPNARSVDDGGGPARAPRTSKVQIFVSFDVDHDEDLYKLLLAESMRSSSSFEVSGGSKRSMPTDAWGEKVRRRIRAADQVIVICGEHTESSVPMSAELRIAQEERTPYVLLWGRREIMCTKPTGAKRTEGMYRWTRQILQEQISLGLRKVNTHATAALMRRVPQER